jgi:hypothetical protein
MSETRAPYTTAPTPSPSIGAGRYMVSSQSDASKSYMVWFSDSANAYRCSCWDARRGECKHGIACRLRDRAAEKIMAARRAGEGEALIGRMLTLSLQGEAGLVPAEHGLTADLILLVNRQLDEQMTMGRAA